MLESKLQRDIRLHLGQKPDLVVWRNHVGGGYSEAGNWANFGLIKGSSDLLGILRPTGRWFAAEVKTANGRLSTEQRAFIALINEAGGYAAVLRSVAEAEDAYQRARAGLAAP